MELISSLRSAFSPGIAWKSCEKENRRLDELAEEVAALARSHGLHAELRPQVGQYQPALVLEYEEDGQQLGCVVHFAWDYGKRRRGDVHIGTAAWLVACAREASALRDRDYTPVLVSSQRLSGTTARFAHDEGLFHVDANPAQARAASDVAWTIGFGR